VPPTGRYLGFFFDFIIFYLYISHWTKTCHLQNRKYITYCIVIGEVPSRGHMYATCSDNLKDGPRRHLSVDIRIVASITAATYCHDCYLLSRSYLYHSVCSVMAQTPLVRLAACVQQIHNVSTASRTNGV